MQKKKQKTTSLLVVMVVTIISVWLAYEFLRYDIEYYTRKYKFDKIFNNTYSKGVKLCRRLIETKSEN